MKTYTEIMEIKLYEKACKDCEFIQVSDNIRLYFEKIQYENSDNNGFDALIITTEGTCFEDLEENDEFAIIAKVRAYFDGIRHLNFDEGEMYFYYPDVREFEKLFKVLRELEVKYCWDCDK